jgi:hypothetical protein
MDHGHSLEFGYFLTAPPPKPRPSSTAPREAGRDPADIRRIYNIPGAFTPDPEMLRTFIEDVAPRVRERIATARGLTGRTIGEEEYGATGA